MAKKPGLAVPSRFALLKIYGDTDEEEESAAKPVASKTTSHKKGTHTKFVPLNAVTSSNSQKNKKKGGKKGNKPVEISADKQFDQGEDDEEKQLQEALRQSRDVYEAEEFRRRELSEHEGEGMTRSMENVSTDQAVGEAEVKGVGSKTFTDTSQENNEGLCDEGETGENDTENNQVTVLVKTTAADAKKILEMSKGRCQTGDSANVTEAALYKLYKSKFGDAAKLAREQECKIKAAEAELAKFKKRNKQYCELLSEAETREKAELIVSRDKTAKLNEELTQQVTDVCTELEQARSRIHELEQELKKHSKHK